MPKLMLMLELRPRRQSEVHQMGDTLLPAAAVRILHAEQLSLCILIRDAQRGLVLGLVLGLRGLAVARSRGVAVPGGGLAAAQAAARGVGEEGLGGGDGWARGGDAGGLLVVGGVLGEGGRLGRHCRGSREAMTRVVGWWCRRKAAGADADVDSVPSRGQ